MDDFVIFHVLAVISLLNGVQTDNLCDARQWYLKSTSDGLFDPPLSREQETIQYEIEDILLQSRKEPAKKQVECILLQQFENILKKKPPIGETISTGTPEEVDESEIDETDIVEEGEDHIDAHSQEHYDGIIDPRQQLQTEQLNQEGTLHESEETNIPYDATLMADTIQETRRETGRKDHETNLHDIGLKENKNEKELEIESQNTIIDPYTNEASKGSEAEESFKPLTETLSIPNIMPELLAEEQPSKIGGEEIINKANKDRGSTGKEHSQDSILHPYGKKSNLLRKKRKCIQFGVCKINSCTAADIFLARYLPQPYYKSTVIDLNKHCTNCESINNPIAMENVNFHGHAIGEQDNIHGDYVVKDLNQEHTKSENKIENVHRANDMTGLPKQPPADNFYEESKVQNAESNNIVKTNNMNRQDNQPFVVNEKTTEKDSTLSDKNSQENIFNTMDQFLKTKTLEYSSKIQNLEILIMNLQNQLLMEKLDKQNHTGTITRLENNILKLENEMLKLNHSHYDLKMENENLNQKKKQFLELDHIPKEGQKADNTKNFEVITEQQNKIGQLSELLKNQSKAIHHMKSKYEYLEDQNRMLFQMVMNQTALMTQMMARVQELSEQNIHQRIEAQNMKERMSQKDKSSQEDISKELMEKLDAIVSDKKLDMVGNGGDKNKNQMGYLDVDESEDKLQNYLRTKKLADIYYDWCGKHRMVCLYKSIRLSTCVPFVPLYWAFCEADAIKNITLPKMEYGYDNRKVENDDKLKEISKNAQIKPITTKVNDGGPESDSNRLDTFVQESDDKIVQVVSSENNVIESKKDPRETNIKQTAQDNVKEVEMPSNTTTQDASKTENNEKVVTKPAEEKIDSAKTDKTIETQNINTDKIPEESTQTASDNQPKETSKEKSDSAATSDQPVKPKSNDQQENIDIKKKDSIKDTTTAPAQQKTDNENNKEKPKVEKATDGNLKPKQQAKKAIPKAEPEKQRTIRYTKSNQKEAKDCYDHYALGHTRNAIYKIKPYGMNKMIEVYCDMKGGGWTIIQKRSDGTTKFFRDWNEYKNGFGGLYGEHWIGNDIIHYLTNQDNYKLRIELTDWTKTKKFAEYDIFSIEDEKEGYKLSIGGYKGDAGDGMAKHNGHKFSTKDVDNDKVVKEFGGSCANRFSGAWWYYKCYMSNLNGIYYRNGQIPPKMFDGITWKPWTGSNYSLRSVDMKIRPLSGRDK